MSTITLFVLALGAFAISLAEEANEPVHQMNEAQNHMIATEKDEQVHRIKEAQHRKIATEKDEQVHRIKEAQHRKKATEKVEYWRDVPMQVGSSTLSCSGKLVMYDDPLGDKSQFDYLCMCRGVVQDRKRRMWNGVRLKMRPTSEACWSPHGTKVRYEYEGWVVKHSCKQRVTKEGFELSAHDIKLIQPKDEQEGPAETHAALLEPHALKALESDDEGRASENIETPKGNQQSKVMNPESESKGVRKDQYSVVPVDDVVREQERSQNSPKVTEKEETGGKVDTIQEAQAGPPKPLKVPQRKSTKSSLRR